MTDLIPHPPSPSPSWRWGDLLISNLQYIKSVIPALWKLKISTHSQWRGCQPAGEGRRKAGQKLRLRKANRRPAFLRPSHLIHGLRHCEDDNCPKRLLINALKSMSGRWRTKQSHRNEKQNGLSVCISGLSAPLPLNSQPSSLVVGTRKNFGTLWRWKKD
jgi:hypothetical protein